eukprot:gene8625-10215_t
MSGITWGEYICYGAVKKAAVTADVAADPDKLIGKLEVALRQMGLSRFSSSIAVQFVASKLRSGKQEIFERAVSYLLSLLNKKGSSLTDIRSSSIYKCPQLIPGLRAQPFWDTAQLPWIARLEAAYDDIKREFMALKEGGLLPSQGTKVSGFQHYRSPKTTTSEDPSNITDSGVSPELGESATDRGQWNVCYFYLHGMDFSDNLARCPITASAIEAVTRQYHHALFSALAPDTHVKPHCGPTNKKLRCHLPLHIPTSHSTVTTEQNNLLGIGMSTTAPDTPWLRVHDQYCALQEGKCIVFDDSFEHEACNNSLTEPRVVLIVDFWHPDLSDEEVKFFDFLNKAQIKAAKQISTALSKEAASENNTGGASKEDFFHVIQAAKEVGIAATDEVNIWA